jgi:hypothetical protein
VPEVVRGAAGEVRLGLRQPQRLHCCIVYPQAQKLMITNNAGQRARADEI